MTHATLAILTKNFKEAASSKSLFVMRVTKSSGVFNSLFKNWIETSWHLYVTSWYPSIGPFNKGNQILLLDEKYLT